MISNTTTYTEYIKNCHAFNRRIAAERKHRLPFLDAQTGIAQSPSHLWRDKSERRSTGDPYVPFVYSAPQRWRRKKSNFNVYTTDVRWATKTEPMDSMDSYGGGGVDQGDGGNSNISGGSGVGMANSAKSDRSIGGGNNESMNASYSTRGGGDGGATANAETKSQQEYYDDYSDPPVDDYEDPSDGDDYEETYVKKKPKKKKTSTGTGEKKTIRRPNDIPDSEKPFMCKHCGAKYKTKPGLHYHLTHAHVNEFNEQKERAQADAAAAVSPAGSFANPVPRPPPPPTMGMPGMPMNVPFTPPHGPHGPPQPSIPPENTGRGGTRPLGKFQGEPNQYCDFCLGDAIENKKTNVPEELINCSDCGRAGHPTCLNFTANMIISTKKYGWQCIECKSCAMCGTSENDDQLLFCDDCDRGFHMYCLRPPLAAPPDGNWSCHLCVVEFGPNASRPAGSVPGPQAE